MTDHFSDRVAVITGGNSGIGLATARRLVAAGARVLIHGRDQRTLDAAVRELGERAHGLRGDITRLTDIDALMAEVRTRFGRIDFLFVNAGIAEFRPMEQVDEALFDRIVNTNFKGAYFTVHKALPLLSEGAAVVVDSSVVNVKGWPGMSVYAPTKAALRSLVRVLAAELAPRRIRVNAVAPGPIDTPAYSRLGMDQATAEQFRAQLEAQVPLGRFGTGDEVAQAVLALVANPYVTGVELPVDGGIAQV